MLTRNVSAFLHPSVESIMMVGFGLVVVLTLVILWSGVRVSARYTELSGWVQHTQEVRTELSHTLSGVTDAETAQRTYLLTGEDADLATYHAAYVLISPQVDHLAALTTDNPTQQRRIALLRQEIQVRLAWLEAALVLRHPQGYVAAYRRMRRGRGRQAMLVVRRDIAEMDGEESRLLKLRTAAYQHFERLTIRLLTGLCTIIFIALGLVFLGVHHIHRARQQALVSEIALRAETQRLADEVAAQLETKQAMFDERERTLQALQQREETIRALNTAMERATEGIAYLDAESRYTYVNEAYAQMAGYSQEELMGMLWLATVPPEVHAFALDEYARMKAEGKATCEVRGVRKDGSLFFKEVTIVRELDPSGCFLGHYAFVRDITERKRYESHLQAANEWLEEANEQLLAQQDEVGSVNLLLEQQITLVNEQRVQLEIQKTELEEANAQLEALATTDGLTGLKNSRSFREQLREEWDRAKRYSLPLSLLLLDVDHFKQFNDAFGHPAGDQVLKQVAAVLQQSARATDFVVRYGGEEFVLILPETDGQSALECAERIRAAIAAQPWELRAITLSVGVTSLQAATEDCTVLIEEADRALYTSKAAGRNCVTHYGQESRKAYAA